MSETTDRTCDGLGWCVKRDAAPLGEPYCNGAGRCVKGYAVVPPADVHYSADGEPLAVQARRLVVENQRLTEKLRRLGELADDLDSYVVARGYPATGTYDDGLNRAQAATAADIRRALDGDAP
jgi:ABC-type branched-subunit amino acid transport system substrate-binding protein